MKYFLQLKLNSRIIFLVYSGNKKNCINMRYKIFILALLVSSSLYAQEVARFIIKAGEKMTDSPVKVAVDGVDYNTDKGSLCLYELIGEKEVSVPCQLEPGHTASLWFILNEDSGKNSERRFVVKIEEGKRGKINGKFIRLEKKQSDLLFLSGEQPLLNYRFGVKYPPEGINPLYRRSAYIHPLWSPGGQVLTRIQPPDHYHHYGIWGPWTKTHIGDREIDFWNLALGQGTVRFSAFLSQIEGNVYTGFRALQQHIDFGAKGEDQVAMNEILDMRIWNVSGDICIIDYTTTINCPLEKGIMLDAYRYGGGIGFRATEEWTRDNSTVLTSDGKSRDEADGSFARWCIVEGESSAGSGRSGILFLSHPSNRMHPEPMRVWPPDANGGRGDLFFEFVPIRHQSWKLESGSDYTLKYRMVVFDGEMDADEAEKYWNGFASLPAVEFLK